MAYSGEHRKVIKGHGVKGKCCEHYKEFANIQLDLDSFLVVIIICNLL